MNKKYNDNSNFFEDWSTKKLKQEIIEYHRLINEIECYSPKDLINLLGIETELKKRKIKIHSEIKFY